jgi:hypothetical protein
MSRPYISESLQVPMFSDDFRFLPEHSRLPIRNSYSRPSSSLAWRSQSESLLFNIINLKSQGLVMKRHQLLTINEAAKAMGVSRNHVRRLVEEADVLGKKARWRYGREIVDLSPVDALRRTLRINIAAVLPQK